MSILSKLLAPFLALFISAPQPVVLSATTAVPPKGANSGEILVGFKKNLKLRDADKEIVHTKKNNKSRKRLTNLEADVVSVQSVDSEIAKYKLDPNVEYAEPNFLAAAFNIPNDTLWSSLWNMPKIGWDKYYGLGTATSTPLVSIIDTGVLDTHPDLSGIVTTGFNAITGSSITTDDNGHGTHVSGIVSAVINNGTGITGLSRSTILPIKVLDSMGSGTYGDIANGIVWATDHGARIINMSLGGSSNSITLQNAVNYALNKGVSVVAAAGNSGTSQLFYPAGYPGVLAVSASDSNDQLASFSNFGSNIFVAAPGVGIASLYLNNGYANMSGTSMAAPHVAGLLAIALMYQNLNSNQLIDLVRQTSDKVGPYAYNSSGWNDHFGYGRISVINMYNKMFPPTPTPLPSPTPVATPSPLPSPSPSPTPTPTPTPKSRPAPTPKTHVRKNDLEIVVPTPSPSPTPQPSPTATAGKATPTPKSEVKFELEGEVKDKSPEKLDQIWTIKVQGQDKTQKVRINSDIKLEDDDRNREGKVHIEGIIVNDEYIAKEIKFQGKVKGYNNFLNLWGLR